MAANSNLTEPYDFYRIKRLPPYVFAEVNKLKAELRAGGMDIIDFGFGNPDLPTAPHIIQKLIETVQKPRTTGYSVSRGILGLRQACARYYKRRFDVELDPSDEIIATMAIVVCFPSNPTGQVCDLSFYEEIVEIAKQTGSIILSDLAYSEIYFSDPPPSIFQVEGSKDCMIIETTSLSKTYSMAGWRMGFAVGNKKLIAALARVKSYLDYGAFTPIQVAACAALDGPQDNVEHARAIYRARRDVMVDSFARAGWPIPSPDASMFTWVPLPDDFKHMGSVEFSKSLMREASVAVSPGVGFGEHGEGYVRIALVENEQRIRQAARNIKAYFAKVRGESHTAKN